MRAKWASTDKEKKELLESCRTVIDIDKEIDFMENAVYEQIIELLYA